MTDDEKVSSILMPYIWQMTQRAKTESFRFVHYTSAETALKILRNKKVWMRRTSMMNDYSEVEHGLRCLANSYNNPDLGGRFKNALNTIYDGMALEVQSQFNDWQDSLALHSYIICISEHVGLEDEHGRLSMWRAYGGSNSVALVLNPEAMMNESDVLNAYSVPVAYTNDDGFGILFTEIIEGIEANIELHKTIPRSDLMPHIAVSLAFQALATKHPGFSEEREWRIVALPNIMGAGNLEKSVEIIQGVPQQVYKIPLENSVENNLDHMELNQLINKIIIGPADFGYPIRDAFIEELEKAGVEEAESKVVVSNIPLR